MKKWKSLFAVATIATMVFSMAACSKEAPVADPVEDPVATEAPAEPTEAPAEEVVEPTEAPAEEVVEPTEAPAEEVVEPTEAPAEEVVEPTEAPAEEVVEPTETPAEEVVEPTEAPAEEVVEPTEAPTEEVVEPTPEPTPEPVVEANPWAFDFNENLGMFFARGTETLEIVDGAMYVSGRTLNWNGPGVNCTDLGVTAGGKTVSVTFKVKSGTGSDIEIKCSCDQDGAAWNQLVQQTVGTEWTELSGSYTVPESVNSVVLYFEASGETDTFYIDDVVFDFK